MKKFCYSPMLQIAKLITIIFFLSTSFSFAADTLTVSGIKGFIFQEKDSDYTVSITSSFKLHEMNVLPDGITLMYSVSQKTFKMYGEAKIVLENDSISISMGDSLSPGIIITNRILQSVNLSISTHFKLKKVDITPQNLTFIWNKGTYLYKMFGDIDVEIDSQKTTAQLGIESNPGIEIENGIIKYINITVTGIIKLKSLTMKPRALTVNWDSDSQFKMFGDVCVMLSNDSLEANLGTVDEPGALLVDGKLTKLDVSLTADFQLKKLTFQPIELTFVWDEPTKRIQIFGAANVKIEKDSLSATLGNSANPGIQITNGDVDNIDITVTGKFSIKNLSIIPKALSFIYDQDSSSYKIYGDVTIMLSKDSLDANLGTSEKAGIVISNGVLTKLDVSLTAAFQLKKLTFQPIELTFVWDEPTKRIQIYGAANVKIEKDSLFATLGNSTNPGIQITNGDVDKIDIGITTDFKLKSLELHPKELSFIWDKKNQYYSIYGTLLTKIEGDSLFTVLGDSTKPGIQIVNGALTNIDIDVTADFKIKSLDFHPVNLTFNWNGSTHQFNMYGNLFVKIDGDSINANLGNINTPGLTITDGVIDTINIIVNGGFQIKKLNLLAKNVAIVFDRANTVYKFSGAIDFIVDKDTLKLTLGTGKSNGIIIKDGKIDQVDIAVTSNFNLKGIVFIPKALTIDYVKNSTQFRMYGDAAIGVEADTFFVNLGDASSPGFNILNGSLQQINAGITGKFKLKSLSLIPNQLTFFYSKADTSYKIFGSLQINIEKDTINAMLGQIENPGLVIKNGLIQNINFGVTANFKMKSLSIKPNGLTFIYNRSLHSYKIFGSVELDIEKDTIKASLGTLKNPGISISQGKVDSIFISVTSHFELKKLTIETDSLGIKWQKKLDGDVFHFFGKVKIDIDSNKIAFDFGNASKPGLVFRNGMIDSLKISTTDDIHFAGFEVATKDLTLEYNKSLYHLYGKILLKKMWSAQIDLGTGPDSGVTLDLSNKPAKFLIDKAEFALDDIDLGPVTLKDLKLNLAQNKVQEADLKVDLPPGWEIDATMQFKYTNNALEINSVDISWEALTFEEAIAIPGTGAFITKLEGGLYGIEDPHEFKVTGDIGIAFGGPFNIPKVGEVALLYLTANTSISRSEFMIDADALMGAYRQTDGTWTSVLGDGHLKLDLLWGNSYSIDGSLNIPSNPWTILKADLEAQLTQAGALNAHIGVALQIPPKIPIVGGRSFAKAEGVIHYDKTDPSSYAAGWAKVNLGFFTWKGGVKYNFQSKDYSILGANEIKDISNVTVAPSATQTGPKYTHDYIKINVVNSPNYVKVKTKFIKKLQGLSIEVDYPIGIGKTNLAPLYFVTGEDKITQSGMDITTIPTFKCQALYNLDSLTFYIMAPGYQQNQKATLPNAEYTLDLLSFLGVSAIKSYEVHEIFTPPVSSWTKQYVQFSPVATGKLSDILWSAKLNYHTACEVYDIDSAIVNVFYTNHVNENGTILKTVKYSDYWGNYPADGEYVKIDNIDFPQKFSIGDSLFLYLTIDDRINAPYKSPVQYCTYSPPFQAQLNIPGMPDSLASGIETKLFIQNTADNNWYAVDSVNRFTNKKGAVAFNYCVSKNTKAKFVFDIPVGYEVDPSSPYTNGEETTIALNSANGGKQVSLLLRRKNNNGVLYVR